MRAARSSAGDRSGSAGSPEVATEFDPISYTAIKILQKRALHTSIPYAAEMADALGVEWRVSGARRRLRRALWGDARAGRYLQFRYDAISSALEAFPDSAVLEIAAGFSTRGLAESPRREAYVETDLPRLIARKPGLIRAIRGSAPADNHLFASLNACSASDMAAAGERIASLGLRKPAVVVHEGILMYLSDAEQAQVRDNIRSFLERHSPTGAWITTDFSERDLDRTPWQRLMTRLLTRRVQRSFNRFPDDGSVREFLARAGLSAEPLPSPWAQDSDGDVRAVAEAFRAWRITLA